MTGSTRVDGVPCWAELDVGDGADADAVAAFYAAILGWSVGDGVTADHQHGTVHHGDVPIAALGSPGATAPPAWTLYLAVDDVDAAAAQLEELGGQVLHGPEDDLAGGRLLVALDAGGAVVGLWESDDAVSPPAPGRLCWAEAASAEPGTTRTFYRELLGWQVADADATGRLVCHGADGRPVAGIGLAGDALPHWLAVFAVADTASAVTTAQQVGGSLLTPGGEGRHAVLVDPAGARFGVLEVG